MRTLCEVDPIAKTPGNVVAGPPCSHGALTVISLLAPMLSEPTWATLADPRGPRPHHGGQRRGLGAASHRQQPWRPAALASRWRAARRRQAEPHPEHHGPRRGRGHGHHRRELCRAGPLGVPLPALRAQRCLALARSSRCSRTARPRSWTPSGWARSIASSTTGWPARRSWPRIEWPTSWPSRRQCRSDAVDGPH